MPRAVSRSAKTRTGRVPAGRRAGPPVSERPAAAGWSIQAKTALFSLAALILAFVAYGPSLNGDFVFDDRTLPFFYKNAEAYPFRAWLGTRPLLMVSYYLNFHTSGLDRVPFHAVNVILHAACSVLIFFALWKILQWAGAGARPRFATALFAAAVFLLHPVQTEAVSYIASRSETLSVLLFLASFNVFLYRKREAIGWGTVAVILVLYLCAMTCKEHTAVLPAVLLLTDYFWNPGFRFAGIRRNWKLYVPIVLGALAGVTFILSYVGKGSNAGFGLEGVQWYQYLFTQFRAIFIYARLFLLPVNQSADYDFPLSHTVMEHGALWFGLALIALVALSLVYRKRFPVAAYGILLALVLLAPTSSIMPIRDPLAERRMYLPFIGFLLIACEWLRRLDWKPAVWAVAGAVCLVLLTLTYRRNGVWVDMQTLWADAYRQNPGNVRAAMGLADGYVVQGRCADALPYFQKAAALKPDYQNVFNLGSAYLCLNQESDAETNFRRALRIQPKAEGWVRLAILDMKRGSFDAAARDLDSAQHLDPGYLDTYNYRGILFLAQTRFDDAAAQFRRVLNQDPNDPMANRGIQRARDHVRQY